MSGYLRYIVNVTDDRNLLRTIQPSEPILAYVSSVEMKDRIKRLNVIRALHENIMRGTIHVGDIGEMVAALILLFAFHKLQTGGPGPIGSISKLITPQ
jgi:hypothetical protein